ncbi:MAG: hypothetical protein KGI08_07605 [Thaumarchaeota archaeon]|nr:hypothetical protein [Nitrososphaerota archaeon]
MSVDKKASKDELPIDWCPICGDNLGDNKKETRINHDKKYHPLYSKAQFIGDVKRNRVKISKGLGITAAIIIGVIFLVHQAIVFNDSISIDCDKVLGDLNNYTIKNGIDKHVLETMNSTDECRFALAVNYTTMKINDSKLINQCKDCNFHVYSFYEKPLSVWNMTKIKSTLAKVPKFCDKNYIVC